jgi:hypothetical protein
MFSLFRKMCLKLKSHYRDLLKTWRITISIHQQISSNSVASPASLQQSATNGFVNNILTCRAVVDKSVASAQQINSKFVRRTRFRTDKSTASRHQVCDISVVCLLNGCSVWILTRRATKLTPIYWWNLAKRFERNFWNCLFAYVVISLRVYAENCQTKLKSRLAFLVFL